MELHFTVGAVCNKAGAWYEGYSDVGEYAAEYPGWVNKPALEIANVAQNTTTNFRTIFIYQNTN